jgi:hypothetical protein
MTGSRDGEKAFYNTVRSKHRSSHSQLLNNLGAFLFFKERKVFHPVNEKKGWSDSLIHTHAVII